MRVTRTLDEFTEACKALLLEPATCTCPHCPDGGRLTAGYGLAGGGCGPYVLCLGCGGVLLKFAEPVDEGADGGAGDR